ncbi:MULTISPECIES: tandem-95 repeat protein [unclassified Psychrobacter]|uniref:tandem-95 repeat protein n=2 Tax=Psychrobacter TaxID=497 RepID=UPI0015F3922C|nr:MULTISPECIES: Ig-like domain-containing protein [unclassified Psychrobacter]MBA6243144.1 tandem-95 repeat protein [Psychrobacter sp. Urea-trap-18]MBA6286202.1 tandem-95 repeat protein [Psychrobacter sp. Urea-trap-16]MBA6317351.1 tandem-95 repeat protein [Psychrobacter sp. Urea-trap-20]
MAQATQLILQKNNADLVNQVLNSNQPTKIVAEEGMQITLIDSKTGQPAKKLQAKKVADNLLIADENGEALLTIEDYYLTDNITLGTVSDIGFVEFNYVSAETGATTQIASETSYTTLVSEMLGDASLIEGISNGALLGSIGAAALGVAAISSNSSDSSPKLPANELPVSKNSNIEATEDTVATGQLEAATDADSDNLTYAIKDNAANGTVTVNADGSYSYTPNADFNGEDSFTYTIDDGQGGMTTQTATITVAAVNDTPVAEDNSISTDEDTVAEGQLVATDIDGDDLTFALDTDANNGTVVVNADGSYSYTPNDNFNGSDSFTYTITDGTETITQTATITVASVNDLPVSKNSNIEATEDTVATGQLEAATDADSDNLTYAIKDNAANGTVIVNADGSYSYTPDTDFNGEDSFTYTIDDGQGGMITQTATITVAAVNDAPVAEDSSISTDEDTVAKGQLVATDVDGDNLTFALDSGASNGTAIVNASGSYSYTPNANFNGSDSFTYTITDGTETITQTATITVASVNDLPVSTDSSSSTNEDAEATGTLATATDADGDELTYALKDTAVNGTVIVNADGSYSYTPNANFNGSDSFIYSIDDGQGGVITQTATIDVAPINDAPVAEDSVIAAIEDTVAEGQLATATDVDGDELTFVLATDASNGTVVVNADGSYSYTPNTNFNGSDNFTYTITDGTETITQTANVTVNSFSEVYNRELQGTFETTVVSEKQVLVDKQSSNTLYDTIVFEVTGDNAGVTLSLFDSSRNINANGSYTLTGPSGSSSGNINVFSAGSSSYNKSLGSNLSPGIYTLSIGIQENGSTISLDVVEFKDVEKTEFVGYQSIMGNIFADDDGGINAPNDYELQINGQSLISQASSSASSPIVIDTDNGQLELSADGSYIYRSNGNELGLDPDQLAEKFDIKVVDLQGSYIGAYRVNITSDTMPPEPGELVFNNFEDTGISQDDGVTQDNTFDLTIKNNEADSQVEYQYSTDQGATWAVLANGTASNLADGDYSFRAKVTDEALNESFTAVRDITIDTTAPILGQILNFNTATNQLEVNADIDQDTLQAFKLENGTLVPLADVTNIPFVEGNYQIQASDVAGNSTSLDFVMSTASEYFESADIIDIVKGSVGNDYIYGDNGDDILISNGGSDHLNGEAGNDTLIYGGNSSGNIRFNGGQGDDAYVIDVRDFVNSPLLTIQDYNGVNRLNLKGVNPSDINLTRNDNSLEISTADGKINLYDQFETGSSFAGVDNIYFDDGTVWDKADIESMVNTGGSNARSIMSFDEAEDSSNDAYSTSDDFIDMSSLGGNIDMYHGNNAALAFNNTDATIQMITFVDSEQIKLPKIDDLLDVNNNELVFESADVVSANTANETATKVFNVASEPSTAVDFTIGQVQALNDNMQTEAMFHII